MRNWILTAVLAGAVLAPGLAQASPEGEWARGDGKARVKIAPCGEDLCAVNTWIKPGVKDEKVGDKLIMTVEPGGEGSWKGSAFDPQRKLKYRISITVEASEMTTSGCVLGGLVCKKMAWTRL